ncbi:MAG: hypothetical protein JJE15_07520 [Desulfobacteraceae bacterium]|nr:hypothetical protein [Desulfobacteraceae bacterium]
MEEFTHKDLLGIGQLTVEDISIILDTAGSSGRGTRRSDSAVLYQVTNGVAVCMAILYLLIGGSRSDNVD